MINFHLHISGPRIRALIALANNEYRHGSGGIVVTGMERDGLVQFKTTDSDIEGVTVSVPSITKRGLTVLDLVTEDVTTYLSRIGARKRHASRSPEGL